MNSALEVTRRLTRAILGTVAVGTLALTGHLALAHAWAAPSPATPARSPADNRTPGAASGSNQPPAAQSQPREGSRSGFGQTPGLQGRSSGGASTTTHGS